MNRERMFHHSPGGHNGLGSPGQNQKLEYSSRTPVCVKGTIPLGIFHCFHRPLAESKRTQRSSHIGCQWHRWQLCQVLHTLASISYPFQMLKRVLLGAFHVALPQERASLDQHKPDFWFPAGPAAARMDLQVASNLTSISTFRGNHFLRMSIHFLWHSKKKKKSWDLDLLTFSISSLPNFFYIYVIRSPFFPALFMLFSVFGRYSDEASRAIMSPLQFITLSSNTMLA